MPRGSKHKERLMHLFSILDKESDKNHRFTLRQLLEMMGLNPEPSSNDGRNLRNDIEVLRSAGYNVAVERHEAPEYYLGARRFTSEELEVLIDIVQSSVSITQEMSDNLVESILSLGSAPEARALREGVRVSNRSKMKNDELFESIHEIQKARSSSPRRKISFNYFSFDFEFNRERHKTKDGSEIIVETPLLLTYSDGAFYVITYSDEKERLVTRRVDRMENVRATEEKGTWKQELQDYDIDDRMVFGMFIDEKPQQVKLIVKKEAMNALIDRFGEKMRIEPLPGGEKARVTVRVAPSKPFEGWVFGLRDLVEVENTTS